jgi:hypothetical protein
MMKLNNIVLAGVLLAAGAVSPAVMAQTVTLNASPYSFSDGGEFTAVTSGPSLVNLSEYSPYTGSGASFQTFCVQSDVEFYEGTAYNYTVSLNSLGNASGLGAPTGTPGTPDNYALSEGTAWLYSQFARGTLSGYDYANSGTGTAAAGLSATRQTDAGYLQSAIWELQGGQSLSGYPNGGTGNLYYNEAVAALGANIDTAATLSTDFGVEILNLGTANDNYQNQLGLVPDGGATLALLALSLAALAVFTLGFGVRPLALQACPPARSCRLPARLR